MLAETTAAHAQPVPEVPALPSPAPLSSASGLVLLDRQFYVIADDENHLLRLDADGLATCQLAFLALAEDRLPDDAALRR